jgi:hypothetical protein
LECPATKVKLEEKLTNPINKSTATLFFKANSVTNNFKSYYPGTQVIGKHFKIRSTDKMELFRHYTVCNAMNPKAYQSYLKALKSGDKRDFERSLLNTDDKNMCMFTIKNYQQPTGLSTRFFGNKYPGEEFEVMGPMGKGLSVQSEGIHIAFAGGTGTLTFVDLVAHLILENLGIITPQDSDLSTGNSFVATESVIGDQKNFKFILYASF